MDKINWTDKLTSRKFWMAICGLVSGVLLALKTDENTVNQISGIIMAGASVIAYIIGEGMADAAGAQSDKDFDAGYEMGLKDGMKKYKPPEDSDDGK